MLFTSLHLTIFHYVNIKFYFNTLKYFDEHNSSGASSQEVKNTNALFSFVPYSQR